MGATLGEWKRNWKLLFRRVGFWLESVGLGITWFLGFRASSSGLRFGAQV